MRRPAAAVRRRYHRNAPLVPLATAPQPTKPPTVAEAPAVACPPRRGSLCSWPPATPKLDFRLPWSSDRSHDETAPEGVEAAPEAVDEPASDDLEWPDTDIHARLGIATSGQRPPDESAPDAAATDAAATDTHDSEESQRMVEIDASAAPAAAPRKPTKLMADLSAAIRATAAAARDQALTQIDADAQQVTEKIREGATEGAAALRKRSDDDVSGIRDWSKAEIARIREETDTRIANRKSQLEGELRRTREP